MGKWNDRMEEKRKRIIGVWDPSASTSSLMLSWVMVVWERLRLCWQKWSNVRSREYKGFSLDSILLFIMKRESVDCGDQVYQHQIEKSFNILSARIRHMAISMAAWIFWTCLLVIWKLVSVSLLEDLTCISKCCYIKPGPAWATLGHFLRFF